MTDPTPTRAEVERLAFKLSTQENEIWEEALERDRARWVREAEHALRRAATTEGEA